MSISTCPRCSEKISIPPGVSSTAKVRCPLCREQYVLADALAAMPPVLEVVEESSDEDLAGGWQSTAAAAPETVDDLAGTVDLSPESNDSDSTLDFGASVSDEPSMSAPADDELWMSDDDTRTEATGFATSEPLVREAAADHDPIELSSVDEQTIIELEKRKQDADKVPPLLGEEEPLELEFDEIEATENAEAPSGNVDFGPAESAGEAAEEELELNFDEVQATEDFSPDATVEFEPAAPSGEAAEEEIELNFEEAAPVAESDPRLESTIEFSAFESEDADDQAEEPLIDFGQAETGEAAMENPLGFVRDPGEPPAEGEEIGLDFGEPVAEAEPVAFEEAAEEDGKRKKKAKKAKKVKAVDESGEEEPRRRGLVGTLVSVMLGALVALPLALYGIMWMGPDYDFFKVGKTLASWKIPLPAAFSKTPPQRMVAAAPQATPPTQAAPPAQAAPVAPGQPAPADATTTQTPQPAAAPSEPAAEQPATAESTSPAPAAAEPAPTAPASTEPVAAADSAEKPAAAPADASATNEQKAAAAEVPAATAASESTKPAGESPETEMPAPAAAEKPVANAQEAKSPPEEAIAETKPAAAEETPAEEMPLEDKLLEEKPAAAAVEKPEPRVAAKPADEELPLPDLDEKPGVAARPAPSADEKPELGDEAAPAPDVDLLGPAGAPEYTVADLGDAIQKTGAAEAKLMAAQSSKDEAAIKSARSQFYLNFFRLAEVVTFATDPAGDGRLAAERESLERIVLQFASDKKRLDALKFNASRWLTFSKRTTPGIVVAGTVVGSETAGKMHRVKLGIGLTSEEPVVAIVLRDNSQLNPGDRVMVLGSIVERPGERLVGYDGDEPSAVWSGMAMKLPPER